MPLQFTENRSSTRINFSTAPRPAMASVVSLTWGNVTGKPGMVLYDSEQGLSESEEAQGRENIGFDSALAGYVVGTKAEAEATDIPADILYVRTTGEDDPGDDYRESAKRGSQPDHSGKFQSSDGAWWEIVGHDTVLDYANTQILINPVFNSENVGGYFATDELVVGDDHMNVYIGAGGFETATVIDDDATGPKRRLTLAGVGVGRLITKMERTEAYGMGSLGFALSGDGNSLYGSLSGQFFGQDLSSAEATAATYYRHPLWYNGSAGTEAAPGTSYSAVNVSGITTAVESVAGENITVATVTTATNHGLTAGQSVRFASVGGMTELNGVTHSVLSVTSATIFKLRQDVAAYTAYTSGGTVIRYWDEPVADNNIDLDDEIYGLETFNPGIRATLAAYTGWADDWDDAADNVGFGRNALNGAVKPVSCSAIGKSSQAYAFAPIQTSTLGAFSLEYGVLATGTTALGYQAAQRLQEDDYSTFVGWRAGWGVTLADESLVLGMNAARNRYELTRSIIIGPRAYALDLGDEAQYVGDTAITDALIIANGESVFPVISADLADGQVGINIDYTDIKGFLHVKRGTGAALGGTFGAEGDIAIFERAADGGVTVLTRNTDIGSLFFGDPDDTDVGGVQYNHSTNVMNLRTGGATRATVAAAGLGLADSGGDHFLTLAVGTNLSAARTLTITPGDADRTVTIGGNATISQDYSTAGTPTFAGLTSSGGVTAQVQNHGTSQAAAALSSTMWASSATGPFFVFAKSRGASIGTNAIVQDDDVLGTIGWAADDGTDTASTAARIRAAIDGTPGTDDVPGRLEFLTTADGDNVPTERLRIDSNGNVVVNTAAIATTATDGFLYVPGCAGTPTGVPTTYTGLVPIVVNTTNNKLYFYSGGAWRDAGP
jgi:hypothetical protein